MTHNSQIYATRDPYSPDSKLLQHLPATTDNQSSMPNIIQDALCVFCITKGKYHFSQPEKFTKCALRISQLFEEHHYPFDIAKILHILHIIALPYYRILHLQSQPQKSGRPAINLHEYQAKELLKRSNVPTYEGTAAEKLEDAVRAYDWSKSLQQITVP